MSIEVLPIQDPRALLQTQPPVPKGKDLAGAAREFEGLLMGQLFQTLRKTVEPSGLFGGNEAARSTYEYLLDQAVVQQAVDGGRSWGLAARFEEAWGRKTKT